MIDYKSWGPADWAVIGIGISLAARLIPTLFGSILMLFSKAYSLGRRGQ